MRQRTGRISLFTLLLLIGIAAGIVGTQRFGPYYWDYWSFQYRFAVEHLSLLRCRLAEDHRDVRR